MYRCPAWHGLAERVARGAVECRMKVHCGFGRVPLSTYSVQGQGFQMAFRQGLPHAENEVESCVVVQLPPLAPSLATT